MGAYLKDDTIVIESDQPGTILKKKQLDFLDDINQRFKPKSKKVHTEKRKIIEDILIAGFREFIEISSKQDIDDNCTVRAYFFIHGLRDSIKTDARLEKEWPTDEEIKEQIVSLILTLSQYWNWDLRTLRKTILSNARKYYPDLKIPFRFGVLLRRFFGKPKLINVRH